MKSFNCFLLILSICYFGLSVFLFVQIFQYDSEIYSTNGRWTLVWDDDFNVPVLDQTKWLVGKQSSDYNSYQKEIQAISDENVAIKNGYLILTSDEMSGKELDNPYYTIHLVSGQVSTKCAWKYGRFEIRAKLPTGNGLLSNFSLQTVDEKISQEILMTMMSGENSYTVLMNNHWGIDRQDHFLQENMFSRGFLDSATKFHIYVIEWEPGGISWYVDNHKIYQSIQYIPETPLSLSVDTTAGTLYLYYMTSRYLDKTITLPSLPQYLIVDWVRVYQRR